MAGHNKWSKVKHIKGAQDAKRGKLFSKLSREITISAKLGGGDIDLNARLRTAVINAKTQNMPSDTIDRAVKKGTGELEGAAIEEIVYEGFAPGGVALLIEVATDNKNRSAADIRRIFNKNEGNLGTSGSTSYLFEHKGEIILPAESIEEEPLLELALEAGAEDVTRDEDSHVIITPADQLYAVATFLKEKELDITSQKLVYIAQTTTSVTDSTTASAVLRLYDALDEYDDTQNVYANFDLADGILEKLSDELATKAS